MKRNWIKRTIAVSLLLSMVICQFPNSVMAEVTNVQPDANLESEVDESSQSEETDGSLGSEADTGEESESTSAESSGKNENSSESEDENMSENSKLSETQEETQEETSDTESETASDTTGNMEEESSTTESSITASSLTEESPVLQVQPRIAADSPSLSLSEVISKFSGDISQDSNQNILTVRDGKGLILLSNVKPEEYQNLTINLVLTTTAGSKYDLTSELSVDDGSSFRFLGLGDISHAFSGTLSFASSSEGAFQTTHALFTALSTDAKLPDSVKFSVASTNTNSPLLAETVIKGSGNSPVDWNVSLDSDSTGTIGGIVGTLSSEASVSLTLTNNLSSSLIVSGSGYTGLFCNTMESGSSLTASYTSGTGTVEVRASADNCDAGGYVGHMESTANLTISGKTVSAVTAGKGNAGGLVGSATDVTIQTSDTATPFSLSGVTVTAGNNKSAGGFVGEYSNTKSTETNMDLSKFQWENINLSGGSDSNVGGVFGALTNSGSYTISGGSVTVNLTAGTNYGGLIGRYSASARSAALAISNITGDNKITSTGGSNANTTYGGVIGMLSGSSYVAIDNVSVSTADMKNDPNAYFGGLVGKMEDGLLNVGSVELETANYDIAYDNVGGRGGVVGAITKGVLRLHGTTDLSGQKITAAYHHTGQIVGNNGHGIVYAVGDGNGNYGESTQNDAWTLKRYNNASRNGSDIGNWGEVVRLDGKNLTECMAGGTVTDTDLFIFNQTDHTVTVNSNLGNSADNSYTIMNIRDFAAYALAFNCYSSSIYPSSNSSVSTVKFKSTVDWTGIQKVTLNVNVDLTGTGILGIGRYENSGNSNYQPYVFKGTFDGGKNTVTIDIGSIYGKAGNSTAAGEGSGQIYAKRNDSRDAHYSLALFPYTSNVTIKNVTVDGGVLCSVGKSSQVENDVRYPIFAAAVIGSAEGTAAFEGVTVNANVSVTDNSGKKIYVMQAGFLGQYAGSDNLLFTDCNWNSDSVVGTNRTQDNHRMGGFVGTMLGGTTLTVKDCTISGQIRSTGNKGNAIVGGLVADSPGAYSNNSNSYNTDKKSSIAISNLTINGAKIDTSAATSTSGGLLGYRWRNTDVIFGSEGSEGTAAKGVTIENSTLDAGSNAVFGGLVYRATDYWDATAANSIQFIKSGETTNIFKGKSQNENPSGLLVGTGLITESNKTTNALYLEVGTWGNVTDAAYKIEENAVTLTLGGNLATTENYFDELVGTTIYDNKGNDNAVVSLAVRDTEGNATGIDNTACNTYRGQIGNFKNSKTRYFYNLDSYRGKDENGNTAVDATNLTTPEQVLSWSVSQYAASNIRDYFCKAGNKAKITGEIDLTGYSYYPVSPLAEVTVGDGNTPTTLTFAYGEMNGKETSNKQFNESNQHNLMHHGLLYNTGSNVTVTGTTFKGTVGLQSVNSSTNSGALIFGNISGDISTSPVRVCTVQLKNVTLAGLKVSGAESATYAPLLINTIGAAVTLEVDNLSTGEGYTADTTTVYAATSLIGNVGSSTAIKLTLIFSNIALDSRKQGTGSGTSVNNNGDENCKVEYNTTHTIFTNATLLESFRYSADSSGVYNFNSNNTKVTYGVEISNTDSGRNKTKQYQYYNGGYVWDGLGTATVEETIKTYFSSGNYLRYVNSVEGKAGGYHELDINQRATNLTEGCGTYGDPYIITDGQQLIDLAKYIDEKDASGFQVTFNTSVIKAKKQEADSYHTSSNRPTSDITYTLSDASWSTETTGAPSINNNDARSYLLNAYYKISGSIDISIADGSYQGLGTDSNPFSGVITGGIVNIKRELTVENSNFSGLIRYSRGSVVKDLTVDYTDATITMSNEDVPGVGGKNPFFGGVVGYCMGGDTIIDNVSVTYGESSITLDGSKARMIATGGYIGLVGGAKNSDAYEKTGGGVMFRKMNGKSNPFTNGTMADNSGARSDYFYCNPYVGRVLDGYACYDTQAEGTFSTDNLILDNTDKNYTIPNLYKLENGTDLSVDNNFNVTVNNAQGMWLLSAIVNSGAGAMDSNHAYKDMYNQDVDAYNLGKPRSASYDKIGTAEGVSDLMDEAFWGGVSTTDKLRVSYLVKKYTLQENEVYYAAQITGGSSTRNSVSLEFNAASIDMSPFGNGFRGIGSSFGNGQNTWNQTGNLKGRFLYVKEITSTENATKICLEIDRHDYWDNYDKNGWFVRGTGLFTGFSYQTNCKIEKITLTGKVKLTIYDVTNGTQKDDIEKNRGQTKREVYGDIAVGGFAGHTVNARDEFSFDNFRLEGLEVYGGHHVAGAIGLLEQAGGTKNVTFTNWSIGKDSNGNGVSVSKKTYDDGSSGGLMGWCRNGSVKITGCGNDSTNWNVDGLTVEAETKSTNTAAAGGLVGATDGTSVTVAKVRAHDLTVNGKNANDVGGLVAGNKEDKANVTIKECYFNNLDISGEGGRYIGGVLGRIEKNTEIDGVTITGTISIYGNNGYVGGMIGYATTNSPLNNCHIIGTANAPVKISSGTIGNYVGGLIGYNSSTTTIKDCTEKYVNILSRNSNAGGLTGQLNNTINISNVEFSNVIVATSKNDKFVGLLTGNTNGKIFNGYNILADSCKVGYNTSATVDTLSSFELMNDKGKTGLWFGQSTGTSTLVAVATKGEIQPKQDVGTKSGTFKVTYADYPVEQKNQPESGTASPWLDVNPKSDVTLDDGTVITGNGVGYITITTTTPGEDESETTTTTQKGIAQTILEEVTSTGTKRYWNLTDGAGKTFSQFLPESGSSQEIYLTSYHAEETEGTTEVPNTVDLPVLVINSTAADVDGKIWSYIAALTNVAKGTDAKEQAYKVTAGTYKWTVPEDSTDGSFVKQDTLSLNVGTDKKTISITRNAYDSQKSQFTLLDVQYTDPTNSSNAFHLYIPVLVKKVMDVKVNVDILAGTNYYAKDYTVFRNQSHYATARPGEPITAYLEYNYHRTAEEWQAAIDGGENLLWYYKKQIYFETSDSTKLPSGTKLTFVDRQTGNMYYKELTDDYTESCFDFSENFTGFQEKPVCDLLHITVADYTEGTDKIAYVETTNQEEATVEVQGTYYRPFDETKDADTIAKKGLTIGTGVVGKDGYLSQGETYFLTIEVPDTQTTVINELIGYTPNRLEAVGSAAPANKVEKEITGKTRYNDRVVIYNGVQQTFTVTTQRVAGNSSSHGGSSGTMMSDGDSLQITLSTELSLLEEEKQQFKDYTPDTMFQQFTIGLKNYDDKNAATQVKIMADTALWELTVKDQTGTELDTLTGTDNVYGKDTLSIVYRGKDNKGQELPGWIKDDTSHQKVIIEVVVTLKYTTVANQFPARVSESAQTGIGVSVQSCVANRESQLPITTLKNAVDDNNRYYIEKLSYATLDYSMKPVAETSDGDKNAPLGINASEDVEETEFTIDTIGNYDCSGVDADVLSNAKKIRYTIQLYQKEQNTNDYSEASLNIGTYWTYCSQSISPGSTGIVITEDITDTSNSKVFRIPITFKVLTGKPFEEAGLMYSNYKVTLKAELLDASGNPLNGTEATDYIIYTNARIYPQMMPEP